MGARIGMSLRRGHSTDGKIAGMVREFKRYQYPPSKRFSAQAIAQLAQGTDYAYAEKLLTWKAAFPSTSSLFVFDQSDLQVNKLAILTLASHLLSRFNLTLLFNNVNIHQHQPNETMHRLETFLNLPHFDYPANVLQSVSHNANLLPAFAYKSMEEKEGTGDRVTSSSGYGNTSAHRIDGITIHKPYTFEDKPLLLKYSRGIFSPSLCLFEKIFGWTIRITTESEL